MPATFLKWMGAIQTQEYASGQARLSCTATNLQENIELSLVAAELDLPDLNGGAQWWAQHAQQLGCPEVFAVWATGGSYFARHGRSPAARRAMASARSWGETRRRNRLFKLLGLALCL